MTKELEMQKVFDFKSERVVSRIAKELNLPLEEAKVLFEHVKFFLYKCACESPKSVRPSSDIDKGWHIFLLFTEEYADFCQTCFGFFIHHRPDDEAVVQKKNAARRKADSEGSGCASASCGSGCGGCGGG